MLFLLFLTLSLWDFWRWKFFSSFNYSIRLNEEFFGVKASLNLLYELHIIQRGLNHDNLVTWRLKINKLTIKILKKSRLKLDLVWFWSSWEGFSGIPPRYPRVYPLKTGPWMEYDFKLEQKWSKVTRWSGAKA